MSQIKFPYPRIVSGETSVSRESMESCAMILEALELRKKYMVYNPYWIKDPEWSISEDPFNPVVVPTTNEEIKSIDGIYQVLDGENKPMFGDVISVAEYYKDYKRLLDICSHGPVKTFSYNRLSLLLRYYKLHVIMNDEKEVEGTKNDPRDFLSVVKVDTHIHLAAAMTSKHLLEFISRKALENGDDIVAVKGDRKISLKQVFEEAKLDPQFITLEMLDTYADTNTFARFDNFNNKYNPFGLGELRDVFLKTHNYIGGKYFAELIQELVAKLNRSNFCKSEWRVSIYGSAPDEWDKLANFMIRNKIYTPAQRWLIQVPRIYPVYRGKNMIQSYQNMIDNIFKPLFDVTKDPQSHPDLYIFLNHISGFDSVDDESRPEGEFNHESSKIKPGDWSSNENPNYAYYCYYFWANITALNKYRQAKGLNTFTFRPHCGEAGDVNHLAAAFLTAKGINHGIQLYYTPPLQYLYYLAQIGLAVSPLSNNKLFTVLARNPFPKLFYRGLNVSLSTDDPLQFHMTDYPLLEEYKIAKHIWNFSDIDISEIARNSVLQSGFDRKDKQNWLGESYDLPGSEGNDVSFSNISDIRLEFRKVTLNNELKTITKFSNLIPRKLSMTGFTHLVIKPALYDCGISQEMRVACTNIAKAINLRKKYKFSPISVPTENSTVLYKFNPRGYFEVFEGISVNGKMFTGTDPLVINPLFTDFLQDYREIQKILSDGPTSTFSIYRLRYLGQMFKIHQILNGKIEKQQIRDVVTTDTLRIYKVDNFVSISNIMSAKQLLKFIIKKYDVDSHEVMIKEPEKINLKQLFDSMNLNKRNLTLDTLNVHAEKTFHRFDLFNSKYNPFGNSLLQTVFLDYNNDIEGRYLAELLQDVIKVKTRRPNQLYEVTITISGRSINEWDNVARWIVQNNLNFPQFKWLACIRLNFSAIKNNGDVKNFEEYLKNIFEPLYQVTHDPNSHPHLAQILPYLSGFSTSNYEGKSDTKTYPYPPDWISDENPPYFYFLYYIWTNINSLNAYRERLGLTKLLFRPVSGFTGSYDELGVAFLVADSVCHGNHLKSSSILQYLYYLEQIGICMAILNEDTVIVDYRDHPFNKFLKRGLNVSISTSNPLQIHFTKDPLSEEYAIASQFWKLGPTEIAEISRNSVLISGFDDEIKAKALGDNYKAGFNDCNRSSVPTVRFQYRRTCLEDEKDLVQQVAL